MKPILLAVLVSLVCVSSAVAQTRMLVGGGPTGTSDFGFNGGWGGSIGLERRLSAAGAFLVRVDGAAVPSSLPTLSFYAVPFSGLNLGESGPTSVNATLLSIMAGLRLGGIGRLAPYLDALVGLGYLNDPANTREPAYVYDHVSSATNVALSFGPGIAVRAASLPTLFADVHYDFYFSRGADTPVIPVRVGLLIP